MTYRVMQLHNGSVEFDSEQGAGTTFHLRFPAIATTEPALTEAAADSQD
jgi:signal transduction histidine kinase